MSFRTSLSNVLSGVRCLTPKEVLDLTNKLAPAATRGEQYAQCLLGILLCFHEAEEERMRALQEHDGCNCLMAAAEVLPRGSLAPSLSLPHRFRPATLEERKFDTLLHFHKMLVLVAYAHCYTFYK